MKNIVNNETCKNSTNVSLYFQQHIDIANTQIIIREAYLHHYYPTEQVSYKRELGAYETSWGRNTAGPKNLTKCHSDTQNVEN